MCSSLAIYTCVNVHLDTKKYWKKLYAKIFFCLRIISNIWNIEQITYYLIIIGSLWNFTWYLNCISTIQKLLYIVWCVLHIVYWCVCLVHSANFTSHWSYAPWFSFFSLFTEVMPLDFQKNTCLPESGGIHIYWHILPYLNVLY